jgi:hypothetical protein
MASRHVSDSHSRVVTVELNAISGRSRLLIVPCKLPLPQTVLPALLFQTLPRVRFLLPVPYQGSDCCSSELPCSDFAVMPCSSRHFAVCLIAPSIFLRIDASLSDMSACAVWGGRAELDEVFDGTISAAEGSAELEVELSILRWAGFAGLAGSVEWLDAIVGGGWWGLGVVRGKNSFVVPANARQHCFAFTGTPISIERDYQLHATA